MMNDQIYVIRNSLFKTNITFALVTVALLAVAVVVLVVAAAAAAIRCLLCCARSRRKWPKRWLCYTHSALPSAAAAASIRMSSRRKEHYSWAMDAARSLRVVRY